ncbi:hypothetical protein K8S17_03165, partial [bacterium]|nr:hypothetical protein [bacterium]
GGDIGAWPVGCSCTTGVDDPTVPDRVALYPPSPSPFAGETVIALDVPLGAGPIRLAVYNVRGQLVRTLLDGPTAPGHRLFRWDGRDATGSPAAAGVYFTRCEWGKRASTQKLVLVR